MKKFFRNRTTLAVISIMLALFLCFAVAPSVNSANSRQTEIVRVTQPITKGTRITRAMVQIVKVGGYNLPSNTVKSVGQVVNKYALADFQPGDSILSTKINDSSPYNGLADLNGTKQAISVTIKSFASGLSGKLAPNDIISFYVADYGDMKETLAPAELQYVQVVTTTNSKGVDNSDQSGKATSKDKADSDDMPSTITVLATPAQAVKLVDFEKNGTLHAALAYRGAPKDAEKFLKLENQYLVSQTQTAETDSISGGTDNGK